MAIEEVAVHPCASVMRTVYVVEEFGVAMGSQMVAELKLNDGAHE